MKALSISPFAGPIINNEKKDSPQPTSKVNALAMNFFLAGATVAFGLVSCYYNPITFVAGVLAVGMLTNVIIEKTPQQIDERRFDESKLFLKNSLDMYEEYEEVKENKLEGVKYYRWAFAKWLRETPNSDPFAAVSLAIISAISYEAEWYSLSFVSSLLNGANVGQLLAKKIFSLSYNV